MTYTAIDQKTMQRLFMGNPFMSQWLSIANTMAGTVRSFWAAEFARMQAAGVQATSREVMRVWSSGWATPIEMAATAPARAAAEIVAVVEETKRAVPTAKPAQMASAKRSAKPAAAKPAQKSPAKRRAKPTAAKSQAAKSASAKSGRKPAASKRTAGRR